MPAPDRYGPDRKRHPREDLVDFAVATGRISAARAEYWRGAAAAGEDISILEVLHPALAGHPVDMRLPDAAADDEFYASLFGDTASRSRGGRSVSAAAGDPGPGGSPAFVEVDAYGVNPLIEALRINSPALYALASRDGPPPTLWETGNLPPFTASGVEVSLLRGLPWQSRLAAAAEPDRAKVLRIVEDTQGDPDMAAYLHGGHPGVGAYEARVRAWAAGPQRTATSYA